MPLRAIARLIQTMLYAKRFFPYYVYNILGGIEEDGMSFLVFVILVTACTSSIHSRFSAFFDVPCARSIVGSPSETETQPLFFTRSQ
jgi:hypothetical protein